MKTRFAILIGAALSATITACGTAQTPPPDSALSSAEPNRIASTPEGLPQAGSTNVAIADDIRRACGLSETESYFAYNSARLDEKSRAVLAKLATCFTEGPLSGRGLLLVGHADPRGDDEYNFVLGSHRAGSVSSALISLGLGSDRISTSSRGELDATGTDEASWATDRRVEVRLGG